MFPLYNLFNNDWYTFGAFFLGIGLILGIMELAKGVFNLSSEFMRKAVHVIVGILVILSPFIFESQYPPLLLAFIFLILNGMAIKYKFLPAIHNTERKTYGTVYFPLTFMVLCITSWHHPVTFIVALSILTFADTIAAIWGKFRSKSPKLALWHDKKSVAGSTAMFLSSFIIILSITIFFSWFTSSMSIISPINVFLIALITSIGATIGEAISSKGSDNLTAPLLTAILFDLTVFLQQDQLINLAVWAGASFIIFLYLVKLKILKVNGMLVAYVMGILIFGIGGASWIIPMLAFFLTSSLLSKISPSKSFNTSKSSHRDMFQVLANGGIPLLAALIFFYTQSSWIYLVYLAAIAAATADTWATEIGSFSKKDPRHILSFMYVPKGTSGGISLIGTLGLALGALMIGLTGYIFGLSLFSVSLIFISGLSGSLIDSILGATAQSKFRCSTCNKVTEKRIHCTNPTTHLNGILWIDNDMVNFINTISSAGIIIAIRIFF